MKKKNKTDQGGFVLAGVMIIALMLSILAITSIARSGTLNLQAAQARQSAQDLWFCEEAMAQTVERFYGGTFSSPATASFSDGSRTVDVGVDVQSPTTNDEGMDVYEVISTASSGGQDLCKVSQLMTVEQKAADSNTNYLEHLITIYPNGDTTSDEYVLILKNGSNIGSHDSDYTTAMAYGDVWVMANITQLEILISGTNDKEATGVTENAEVDEPIIPLSY